MDASNPEALLHSVGADRMSEHLNKAIDLAMQYGPRLLLAIIVLLVGLWICWLMNCQFRIAMLKFRI